VREIGYIFIGAAAWQRWIILLSAMRCVEVVVEVTNEFTRTQPFGALHKSYYQIPFITNRPLDHKM
jgi:hypothetical protein